MSVANWASGRLFNLIHRRNLVYNTCWEDPRLDRQALELGPTDNVMVITSAGCNALDYALTEPKHVYAVDMNPHQNALLELKLSGIRNLDHATFFSMFGHGRLAEAKAVYHDALRADLSPWVRRFWDKRIKFFSSRRRRSFYFCGTSGAFARLISIYIDRVVKLRQPVTDILEAKTLAEQQEIYERHLRDRFWTRPLRFTMSRDTTWALLGVPRAQREHREAHYEGSIVAFVNDCLEAVFCRLPLSDNYFWRVYITGRYTPECCPEYLKADNFARLKGGLADRVSTHTNSVQGFLEETDVAISRFVLLDHMDWLYGKLNPALEAEWQAIVERAAPGTRIIWRSGGLRTDFVDGIRVLHHGRPQRVGEMLTYHRELADQLHPLDRVHTYGSFHIADLAV